MYSNKHCLVWLKFRPINTSLVGVKERGWRYRVNYWYKSNILMKCFPLVSSEQYFKITWLHVTTVYRQLCLSVLLTPAYLKNFGFFYFLEKTNVENNPVKTFYIQDSPHAKGEGARREKWSDFAESSSLHGLRNVFVRSSPYVRIFWLVLLLAFTAWVLYSMYSSIYKYFQYPIATVIRIRYPLTRLHDRVWYNGS